MRADNIYCSKVMKEARTTGRTTGRTNERTDRKTDERWMDGWTVTWWPVTGGVAGVAFHIPVFSF